MTQGVEPEEDVDPWRPQARRVRRPRRQLPMWQELPLLLVVAFCLAVLIRTFLLQAFFIPSGSMEDTLLIGDRVLVNKVVYDLRDPVRGEVVVFRGTNAWAPEVAAEKNPGFLPKLGRTVGDLVGVSRPSEKDFIKRVIGVPGDRVKCCDPQGRVTVNGVALDETYVLQDSPLDLPPNANECRSRRFAEVVVPPGQLFVMGDHRLVSQDARCQGPVPIDNVIGRAFAVVWPYSRWTALSVPKTFADVPKAAVASAPGARAPGGRAPGRPQGPALAAEMATGGPVLVPLLIFARFTARARQRSTARRRRLLP